MCSLHVVWFLVMTFLYSEKFKEIVNSLNSDLIVMSMVGLIDSLKPNILDTVQCEFGEKGVSQEQDTIYSTSGDVINVGMYPFVARDKDSLQEVMDKEHLEKPQPLISAN